MNFSSLSQESGSVMSKMKLSSKREHSPITTSFGSLPSPRSHAKSHDNNKRFKPNLNISRSHIPNENVEDLHYTDTKGSPSETMQCPVKCHFNEAGAHQGSLNAATEEEDDDEASKPFGGSKKNCLNNNPSLGGEHFRTESVSTTPSVISPWTSSLGSAESVKELNLDASQGSSCNDTADKFDEKEYLQIIQNTIGQYGFKCLSAKCPNVDTFLNFRCNEGHIFSATFDASKRIVCPKCQRRLQECADYAKLHNGML